jgi:GntR family transcriptional regulator, arabinose operon transcriptional repressor
MKMKIDKKNAVNISQQVKEDLRERITVGEFIDDKRLPSERQLSAEYRVSRLSVRQAITELIGEGYLYRIPYRGTYITRQDDYAGTSIGLLVSPSLSVSFFPAVLSGIEKSISREGYKLLLKCSHEEASLERKYIEELTGDTIKGLIIISGSCSSANIDILKQISHKIPIVLVDLYLGGVEADYVCSDDERGGYEATRHLLDLGHKQILHVGGEEQDSTARQRLKGYKRAMEETGIGYNEDMVIYTDWKAETGYYKTKKFMLKRRESDRPTGIFACNDELAIGVYRGLQELGLKIPQEISLVGYGNLDIGFLLESPLTTVNQQPEKMGEQACALLIERIKKQRDFHDIKKVIIKTELVVRESCGIKKQVFNY